MSNLVVILFDSSEDAGKAFKALQKVQKSGHLRIDDAAVVIKEQSGKVEVKNILDRGVKVGLLGGSLLGLMLGGIFFPLAGLALGAAGGALLGRMAELGVDQKFVKEVTEQIEPGNSALFLMVGPGDPDVAIAALRPFEGTVYHTSLPTEAVESLKAALDD
jgi:uncharacterized membrane protein